MPGIKSVRLVVGMEVHVELNTRTKMFSRAPSVASSERDGGLSHEAMGPNTAIDPVVLGLPGSLPVINREAITKSIGVGLSLGCSIAKLTKWDRKGYFYPDLPKGYQISQYDLPLCFDGAVDVASGEGTRRIGIIRAHLEEDAGKLMHEAPGVAAGSGELDGSIVDLNRAGTALLEIVTAPDFRDSDECVAFAQDLRNLCRFLRVTEGVMQKGHMRFEPNINCVLELDGGTLVKTPIVEVKNLNSFRSLKNAIEFELREQPGRWLEDGREMSPGNKTTRGWDDVKMMTFLQRQKEDAADYRYFPDPDLLPVVIDEAWLASVRDGLPASPRAKATALVSEYALTPKEAEALTEDRAVSDLFDASVDEACSLGVARHQAARLVTNLILQSGGKRANERTASAIAEHGQHAQPVLVSDLGVNAKHLGELASLRDAGKISAAHSDELFGLIAGGEAAAAGVEALATSRSMLLVRDDGAIDAWVRQAIADNAKAAEDVRAGKDQALGRIVGSAMKLAAGNADAATMRERILKALRG
jgi:aspartyl-tRNA(Asn)/glutamyl-tRNA(Gln) amidotransferase subunit B